MTSNSPTGDNAAASTAALQPWSEGEGGATPATPRLVGKAYMICSSLMMRLASADFRRCRTNGCFFHQPSNRYSGNVVLIPDGGKNRCTGQFPSCLGENECTVVLSRPWSTRCPRERQRLVNIHVVQGQTEGRIVGDIPTCGAAVLGFGWFGWADCHHDFLPRPFRPT